MGTPVAFFRHHELGTGMISIVARPQRVYATHPGLHRVTTTPESTNPNWTWNLTAIIAFTNNAWTREDFQANISELMIDIVGDTINKPTGPLCWIEDNAHATTTTADETTGSDVVVNLASLSTLNVSVNDYVLLFDETANVALLVKVEATGSDTITVDLDEDVPTGSLAYKVFVGYDDSIIHAIDPGDPVEQARDRYRFQTRWRFTSGALPVKSPSGA